jgi:hypothetical protein
MEQVWGLHFPRPCEQKSRWGLGTSVPQRAGEGEAILPSKQGTRTRKDDLPKEMEH